MQATSTGTGHDTARDELGALVDSWLRHLRAQRMSPATLSTYGTSARQLAAFLADRGMPTTRAGITREHIEAFVSDLLARFKPATAHNRYRALRTFFGWLVDEGEIRESPMARMRPPRLPEEPPAVLR
jgi:site-specific recombinase XerD